MIPTIPFFFERDAKPSLGILEVCQELHMSRTGSADPLSDEMRVAMRTWLSSRLQLWRPSVGEQWRPYDEGIRSLIAATLAETT